MTPEVLVLPLADCLEFMVRTQQLVPAAPLAIRRKKVELAQQDVANRMRDLQEAEVEPHLWLLEEHDAPVSSEVTGMTRAQCIWFLADTRSLVNGTPAYQQVTYISCRLSLFFNERILSAISPILSHILL